MVANAITQYEDHPRALLIAPSEFELMWRIAKVAHESKMSGLQSPEQAMFIMLKGYEIGIKPMQALSGMHSIQGKPTMSPQLMLAMVRKSGQLEAVEIPDVQSITNSCTVMIKRRGEKEHRETYTMDMARSMQLTEKDNWKKQPAVMLRWRTVSAALRMVFPDIIEGLYMPEEIDPDTVVDENGAVVGETPANVVPMPRQDAPKPPVLEPYNTHPVDGSGALIPDVLEDEKPPTVSTNEARAALGTPKNQRVPAQAEPLQTFVPEGFIPFHTIRVEKPAAKAKPIVKLISGTNALDQLEVIEYVEDGIIGRMTLHGYAYDFIKGDLTVEPGEYLLQPNLYATVTIKGGEGKDRNNRRIGSIRKLEEVQASGDGEVDTFTTVATAARRFEETKNNRKQAGIIFKTGAGDIRIFGRDLMRRDLPETWILYTDGWGINEQRTFLIDGMSDLKLTYKVNEQGYKNVTAFAEQRNELTATDPSAIDFNS